jgi:hypothetical protein
MSVMYVQRYVRLVPLQVNKLPAKRAATFLEFFQWAKFGDFITTIWMVRGSNPGRGEIFHTRPDRPWGPPSLLYNGYRVFLWDKTAGAWC